MIHSEVDVVYLLAPGDGVPIAKPSLDPFTGAPTVPTQPIDGFGTACRTAHFCLTVRQNHSPALAFYGKDDVRVAVRLAGHRDRWGLRLEPDALNPCRYRAFVGDCIRGTSSVAVLFSCRIGTKP